MFALSQEGKPKTTDNEEDDEDDNNDIKFSDCSFFCRLVLMEQLQYNMTCTSY